MRTGNAMGKSEPISDEILKEVMQMAKLKKVKYIKPIVINSIDELQRIEPIRFNDVSEPETIEPIVLEQIETDKKEFTVMLEKQRQEKIRTKY